MHYKSAYDDDVDVIKQTHNVLCMCLDCTVFIYEQCSVT